MNGVVAHYDIDYRHRDLLHRLFVGVLPVEHLLYEGDDLLVLFDFLNNLTALRFFDVVTIKQVFDHFHDILNWIW